MKPIRPEELSGLIDNELPEPRAGEIREAIRQQSSLRQQYEEMQAVHGQLLNYAGDLQTAQADSVRAVSPEPLVPRYDQKVFLILAGVMLMLRVLSKFMSPVTGIALEVCVLVMIQGFAAARLLREADASQLKGRLDLHLG